MSTTPDTLPPLPEPEFTLQHEDACGDQVGPPDLFYSEQQMREYAEAAVRAAQPDARGYVNMAAVRKLLAAQQTPLTTPEQSAAEAALLTRALAAQPAAEPVAWRYRVPAAGGGSAWTFTPPQPELLLETQPLYAGAPAAGQAAQR